MDSQQQGAGQRVPIANYGSMEPLNDPNATSDGSPQDRCRKRQSESSQTRARETRPSTQQFPSSTQPLTSPEPPKPAIRQKIQRGQQQQHQARVEASSRPLMGADELSVVGRSQTKLSQDPSGAELVEFKLAQEEARKRSPLDEELVSSQHLLARSKGPAGLALPTEAGKSKELRPYPRKVFFIVANEFCERFSYYGLRTVLVLYFRSVLGFSDANSTVSFHLFATLCYLTPIFGAIMADSIWGKFRTILYLSFVYLFGEIVLLLSSIFWNFGALSVSSTFVGLLLIGIGTGGIKPCVGVLGGDQFEANEQKRRENFFSIFYAAINLGALLSNFLTPLLRSNNRCVNRSDCYPLAFGVPALLMLAAIGFFLAARNHYVLKPLPERNIILAFCQCSWLAFKRRLAGQRLPDDRQLRGQINLSLSQDSTSSSGLSVGSNDHIRLPPAIQSRGAESTQPQPPPTTTTSGLIPSTNQEEAVKRDHWLYLALDRFDSKLIEDFRSVWSIILIFLPTPLYWCLFDQQGSLWTLQATRMDGRLFNSSYYIEPDQIGVANPLLLLASIPLFQLVIYPTLARCNLLEKPIQRMATGGFIAALTFVVSALIEVQIQQNSPMEMPLPGHAHLLLANGLTDCSLANPTISFVQNLNATSLDTAPVPIELVGHWMGPLSSRKVELPVAGPNSNGARYKLQFKLSNNHQEDFLDLQQLGGNLTTTNPPTTVPPITGCPFSQSQLNELTVGALREGVVKLLYLEQGNGRLSYKLLNDSLKLPAAGKARIRLLFEFFGSYVPAERRSFRLVRESDSAVESSKPHPELQFKWSARDGQVLSSDYIEVAVPGSGALFSLETSDSNQPAVNRSLATGLRLEPGTRNMILVHQRDAQSFEVRKELLQDNKYRISVLYQLLPYMMISMSEVLFSITALEFAYSVAPDSMKAIVFSLVSTTTAIGNLLTALVESVHPFDNVIHDFLFYATLMAADMVIFAFIGYFYKPYRSSSADPPAPAEGARVEGPRDQGNKRD